MRRPSTRTAGRLQAWTISAGPSSGRSQRSEGDTADLWRFHYGAWLAGRGDMETATRILSACQIGVAKALLARLLASQGDLPGAAQAFAAIRERWLQLHPQVVVERDVVLRRLGRRTLAEREQWLNSVSALTDEWIAERRVQLLIDKGNVASAKQLLLSTHFQKVHQTYSRTGMWMQICKAAERAVRADPAVAWRGPAGDVRRVSRIQVGPASAAATLRNGAAHGHIPSGRLPA